MDDHLEEQYVAAAAARYQQEGIDEETAQRMAEEDIQEIRRAVEARETPAD